MFESRHESRQQRTQTLLQDEQELQELTAGDRVRGQHEVLEDHRAAVVGRRGEVNPDPAGVRAGPQALLRDRGARPAA